MLDELSRTRKPHVTPAGSPRRQTIEGDYRKNDVGSGAVVGLNQERNALSPEEVDEQIRRFFEERQP